MKNNSNRYVYRLNGLDCANCANKIQATLEKNESFSHVNVNFSTTKLTFESNLEEDVKACVTKIITKIEPEVEVLEVQEKRKKEKNIGNFIRLLVGILLALFALVVPMDEKLKLLVSIMAYVILLSRVAVVAIKQLFKNRVLDENTLITISAIGAFIIGESLEGMFVVILYEIGKILEDKAIHRTRKSIEDLMDIKPEYANLLVNGVAKVVSPTEVQLGDRVLIKNGEKIPLDGIVVKGTAKIDNSMLTGESQLISVAQGDNVLSGSINTDGILEVEVQKVYQDSTVSKILELVENATDRKAKTETFVSRFAKIYTPIVILFAILIAIFMPIVISGISYETSIYRALIFLVISCPCAIAISVPLSYFSGIGRASKAGILIKGSDFLDGIQEIKSVAFDKTGTLTNGKFQVASVKVLDEKYTPKELLKICAVGEKYSNHPIAFSIVEKYGEDLTFLSVENYEEIAGKGIRYQFEGKEVLVGNQYLISYPERIEEEATVIWIAIDGNVAGYFVIQDGIKVGVKETIKELQKQGIQAKMFTGDNKKVALRVAKEIGISEVYYEMLPDRKYQKMEELLQEKKNPGEKIAFVGDGINDSPVLAISDIGFAMGGVGSSSAIEASDVVIMTDEVHKIIDAIHISRKTNQIIKQNLIFAIGIKFLFLTLSLFGISNMWEAIFADVGVTLITILNSIRILKMRI